MRPFFTMMEVLCFIYDFVDQLRESPCYREVTVQPVETTYFNVVFPPIGSYTYCSSGPHCLSQLVNWGILAWRVSYDDDTIKIFGYFFSGLYAHYGVGMVFGEPTIVLRGERSLNDFRTFRPYDKNLDWFFFHGFFFNLFIFCLCRTLKFQHLLVLRNS